MNERPDVPISKRPFLPKRLMVPNFFETLLVASYGMVLWLLPAFTAYHIFQTEWNVSLKILSTILLIWVSGYGLMVQGLMGHDGIHRNLHKNKYVSMVLGIVFSSTIFGFLSTTFALRHWDHHRYVNKKNDPDVSFFGSYKALFSRLFLARLKFNHDQLAIAWKMFVGKLIPRRIQGPFNNKEMRLFIGINFLFQLFWILVYVLVLLHDAVLFIFVVLLPHISVLSSSGIQPFQEHADTGDNIWTNARSLVSPLWTIVLVGNNYHLEHHLYPNVPGWRLPKVHRILREKDLITEDMHIDKRFLSGFKYGRSKYQYPAGYIDR